MKRIISRQITEDGFAIPKWYRVAYRDFDTASCILYPIGIHWVVSLFHFLYRASYYYIRPTKVEVALTKAYNNGVSVGRDSEKLYWEKNVDEIVKRKVQEKTLDLADVILQTIANSMKEKKNEMETTRDV